ncbi:hypothetical protein GC194_12225 [bacterium]|nr:hypothetical protein [bacterium]
MSSNIPSTHFAIYSLRKKALQHVRNALMPGNAAENLYLQLLNRNEILQYQINEPTKAVAAAEKEYVEDVVFEKEARLAGHIQQESSPAFTYFEMYYYKVDATKLEQHYQNKRRFAEMLQHKAPGFVAYEWYTCLDDAAWQIDIYRYEHVAGAFGLNDQIEKEAITGAFYTDIIELKFFKTFTKLRAEVEKTQWHKATNANYYKAKTQPQLLQLGMHHYLSASGVSAPDDERFALAISQLYKVAYQLKFACKELGHDFFIPKLEAFWYAPEGKEFSELPKSEWCWEVCMPMPDFVHYILVRETLKEHGLQDVFSFKIAEAGQFAQLLHKGSYDAEEENVALLHQFIAAQGLKIAGNHKEIYLKDPAKTASDRLETIIRYQVG